MKPSSIQILSCAIGILLLQSPTLAQTVPDAVAGEDHIAVQDEDIYDFDEWTDLALAKLRGLPEFQATYAEMSRKYATARAAGRAEIVDNFKRFDRVRRISRTEILFYWGECAAEFDDELYVNDMDGPSIDPATVGVDTEEKIELEIAYTGQDFETVRANLVRHGYPTRLLFPLIDMHDKVWLAIWTARLLKIRKVRLPSEAEELTSSEWYNAAFDLGSTINNELNRIGSRRPRLGDAGGCGGEEEHPALLRTAPAGGQLWVIKSFPFRLCKANGLDPWDRRACEFWHRTDPDRVMNIAGNIFYVIQFPGKTPRQDRTYLAPGDSDVEPKTYYFR